MAGAAVEAPHVARLPREPGVHALVAQVDTIGNPAPQEKLVAEMARLVEQPDDGGDVLIAIAQRHGDEVVGVDQILRRSVQIEEGEDAGLEPDLPPAGAQPPAVEREGLTEADRGDVFQLLVVEVALVGRGEMRPTADPRSAAWTAAPPPAGSPAPAP